ncbi:MAG TPA: hypothetical protein VKV17_06110 [Bryobacteraceae bacterium]|nr:hypothetical protein [Bryobacteraceae bacterium]
MLKLLWSLARGYRLRPWRSPYLRWRIETYWGIHAERIAFAEFWRFVRNHWQDLWRYLRWAAGMRRPAVSRLGVATR